MGKLDQIITQVNADITTKEDPNSILPEDVGGSIVSLCETLNPLLDEKQGAWGGSAVPSNALGKEGDFYYRTGNNVDVYQKGAANWGAVLFTIPLGFTFPDGIISGLQSSVSGLVVTIDSGAWYIDNILYQKATQTQFTLDDPGETFDRIDVIYANKSNQILLIKGTASATPVKPAIPADTIEVTFILVSATVGPAIESGARKTVISYTPAQVVALNGVISINYNALKDTHGDNPGDVKVWFDNQLQPVLPVLDNIDAPSTITLDLGTYPSTNTKIIII